MVYGQNKFTINYIYTDATLGTGFYFPLLKPYTRYPYQAPSNYKLETISNSVDNKELHTKCTFSVGDTAVSMIGDGYGRQFFVLPGDEVTIRFHQMAKTGKTYRLHEKYLSPYFNDFSYEGKNKYVYALFDSISYYSGTLFWADGVDLKSVNFQLKAYFDSLTSVYKGRLAYLTDYSQRHSIPHKIQQLAAAEIKAAYIDHLIFPITNKAREYTYQDFPQGYINSLKRMNYDNPSIFFDSMLYNSYSYRYIMFVQGRSSFEKEDEDARFKRMYDVICNQYTDARIKERLLADHLMGHVNDNYTYQDTALYNFNVLYPDSYYTKHIDSMYAARKIKMKANIEDILMAEVSDINGIKTTLKSLMKSKPVVIDCWASWCKPCLEQMPFSREIEAKYLGKANFVYLSFDKDPSAWLAKSQTLGFSSGTSYLLTDNFKSAFADYFDVFGIPRYVIFDKNGKLFNADAPRPSRKESFDKILDALVK
ncbi:MAG: TlpA family protein disulfide reductase [Mucilaginibacter sp.]